MILERLVGAIDRRLRASQGIIEYSRHPDCIFRIQLASSQDDLVLDGGAIIRSGDRLIVLHLWNEHLHAFPSDGPTVGWARWMSRALQTSLRELDVWLASQPQLDDIGAIKAEMTLAAADRTKQLLAISRRYGFVPFEAPDGSFRTRLHRFGENILIALLVSVHNPRALGSRPLRRSRSFVVLTRQRLHALCAPVASTSMGRRHS